MSEFEKMMEESLAREGLADGASIRESLEQGDLLDRFEKTRRIDEVTERVMRKYRGFDALQKFVVYLGLLEKSFVDYAGDREEMIKRYVEMEIRYFSQSSGINEDVFLQIYDKFSGDIKADRIGMVVQKIESEYPKNPEYKEFVIYLGKIFNSPKEILEKIVKRRMIEEKIKEIASDGKHSIDELEKIYEEFVQRLSDEGLIEKIKI